MRSRQAAVKGGRPGSGARSVLSDLLCEVGQNRLERLVAKQLLTRPEAKRLMTVPGVNLIAAATFLAAVGDIARFRSSREAGRLPRSRSTGQAVRRAAGPLGQHLQARVGVGALGAG
jgi:transposase